MARYRPTPMMQLMAGTPQIKLLSTSFTFLIVSSIISLLLDDYTDNIKFCQGIHIGFQSSAATYGHYSPIPGNKKPGTEMQSHSETRMKYPMIICGNEQDFLKSHHKSCNTNTVCAIGAFSLCRFQIPVKHNKTSNPG